MTPPGEVDLEYLPPHRLRRKVPEHGLEGRRLIRLADIECRDTGPAGWRRHIERSEPRRLAAARIERIGRPVERTEAVNHGALRQNELTELAERGRREAGSRHSQRTYLPTSCRAASITTSGLSVSTSIGRRQPPTQAFGAVNHSAICQFDSFRFRMCRISAS